MDILGYLSALIIGIVLGLVGGGGSILTLPVFVYLLNINPVLATAYSLFVVGGTALVGTIQNGLKGLVDFKTGVIFAIPAFIAVYLTRQFLVPAIPENLFEIGGFQVTKSIAIMVFFAVIMLVAAFSMIRGNSEDSNEEQTVQYNFPVIAIEGLVVGVLTGIVGAGGGFLIIPALVLLAKLPMKKAVATSLMIIAIKSLIGFMGDISNPEIDWVFLLLFTAFSIVGIFVGIYLSKFVNEQKLKIGFGYFVLAMGVYILIKETLL